MQSIKLHLIDGTYELFRNYFGAPKVSSPKGVEVGAVRGLCRTLLALVTKEKATHVGVAFDHVIESFRNELFDGYKTGEGIPEELALQFPLAERAAKAMGFVMWPMVEFEADDALASAAHRFKDDPRVEQILLCSPDKDLAQCVGGKILCLDRRREILLDEAGVRAKFGVAPSSIADFLALVGDTADGIPGIPKFGEKAAAAVLSAYRTIEEIPDNGWSVSIRGAEKLAETLRQNKEEALLYKKLATLRVDAPIQESLDDLEWRGAHRKELTALCEELGEAAILGRIKEWRTE